MGMSSQGRPPDALPPGDTNGTNCARGSVGPAAGLDERRESRLLRDSVPGPASL